MLHQVHLFRRVVKPYHQSHTYRLPVRNVLELILLLFSGNY